MSFRISHFRLFFVLGLILLTTYGQAQHLCGNTRLNLTKGEKCCNGKVFNRFNNLGQELDCCNNQGLYVTSEEVCCGQQNAIKKFENRKERMCCQGDKPNYELDRIFIPQDNEFCCGGALQTLQKHEAIDDFKCCGTILIPKKEGCCESKYTNIQTIQSLHENEHCCGASKYNNNSHWCTKERILPRGIDLCGDKEYNITCEVCCHGNSTEIKPTSGRGNWSCENGKVFDKDKQYMHKSEQIVLDLDKDICKGYVYEKEKQECCDGCLHNKTSGGTCCGREYMKSTGQGCCLNTIYNPTFQKCCNTKVISRSYQGCCGRTPYNLSREVCCRKNIDSNSEPIEKKKPNDTHCCKYDGKPYNKHNEMCKEDVGVYPKESDQPQDEEEVPEESPQEERRMQPKSPFCRSGKVAQIQKTCEKTNDFKAWLVSVNTTSRGMTMQVIGSWPRSVCGHVIDIQVKAKAKCIIKWKGFVWVITNRKIWRRGKKLSLKVTGKDLIMRDTHRNRRLRSRHCKRS